MHTKGKNSSSGWSVGADINLAGGFGGAAINLSGSAVFIGDYRLYRQIQNTPANKVPEGTKPVGTGNTTTGGNKGGISAPNGQQGGQVNSGTSNNLYGKVNNETKFVSAPEVKLPTQIKSNDAVKDWNTFLGDNPINIHPRTGQPDPDRLFSADGTKSIRFGSHEMKSLSTPKGHYHKEYWNYNYETNEVTVENFLQRILP